MNHMLKSSLIFIACLPLTLLLLTDEAKAVELLMFDDEYCSWCERWDREIGVIYSLVPESCLAPLRKIDIHEQIPTSLSILEPVLYTPTFVLVHNQKEVARITGYPGEDFFWPMLNDILAENLPEDAQDSGACRYPQS